MNWLMTLFPFLRWFPMSRSSLRADLVAGITIALILVPQSMAYASLAGLPVVYGLYASFLPVIVASLWGSSNQLHTGPVAMLSLMSAAAVMSYATPGSDDFIQISLMLALMVGILRLLLGIFKLGVIVNLLSSPVIVGFTNAAALIIGLSQLNKIIGVPFPRSDSYLFDLTGVILQIPQLQWGTLIMAIFAWLLIAGIPRITKKIPGILAAVVIATIASAIFNYENIISVSNSQIKDASTLQTIEAYAKAQARITQLTEMLTTNNRKAEELEQKGGMENIKIASALHADASIYNYELEDLKYQNNERRIELHSMTLIGTLNNQGELDLYVKDAMPAGASSDDKSWRFNGIKNDQILLSTGGAVVGDIPQGLPSFKVPEIKLELVLSLFPAALVMALIGFMEATSISKAIATTTGERVNTSKELIGQGLANIVGSFFGSYTVSGSFSRSAVAAKTGATSGLFAIISALAVVLVLLYFTAYLYHLPQAVLAVIVMMAVFSLIRIDPLIHAWQIDRPGAVIGITTFLATLIMAPNIANGILLGVTLTIVHFLVTSMKPRADIISRKADGSLGGVRAHSLKPMSENFVPVRFDGPLNFVNVAYFEDMILEAHATFPKATTILVVGSGINDIDVSGEEKIRDVAKRLRKVGVSLIFSSLKHQVMSVLVKSGVVKELGKYAFYPDKASALKQLTDADADDYDWSRGEDDKAVAKTDTGKSTV